MSFYTSLNGMKNAQLVPIHLRLSLFGFFITQRLALEFFLILLLSRQ